MFSCWLLFITESVRDIACILVSILQKPRVVKTNHLSSTFFILFKLWNRLNQEQSFVHSPFNNKLLSIFVFKISNMNRLRNNTIICLFLLSGMYYANFADGSIDVPTGPAVEGNYTSVWLKANWFPRILVTCWTYCWRDCLRRYASSEWKCINNPTMGFLYFCKCKVSILNIEEQIKNGELGDCL